MATEPEAREEAARLGIRILQIEPIGVLDARRRADDVALPEWNWPALNWRTRRWALVRLGLEHPRWGRVLWVIVAASAILIRSKIVPAMIAVLIGAGLAAAGLRADPQMLVAVMAFAIMFVPLMLAKPWIYWRLTRQHAADGFDRERRLEVRDGEIRWFDGHQARTLPAGAILRVYELPHSILLGLRYGGEIAIPTAAFANAGWARRFAQQVAHHAGVAPRMGYRSAWLGPKKQLTPLETAILVVMSIVGCALLLLMLLMILFR